VWGYLDGEYDFDEMVARGIAATRQLAKRQLTWLRGWPSLIPLIVDDNEEKVADFDELVVNCLKYLQNSPIY